MTTPFLGEIQLVAGSKMMPNFALCNGASIGVQQNPTLFSLISSYYGGDGVTNFLLPNLVGRAVVGQGAAPGLSSRRIGDTFGENAVTLTNATMPQHLHFLTIWEERGAANRTDAPGNGNALGNPTTCTPFVTVAEDSTVGTVPLNPGAVLATGGGGAHENRQPFVAMNFSICLSGVIPHF